MVNSRLSFQYLQWIWKKNKIVLFSKLLKGKFIIGISMSQKKFIRTSPDSASIIGQEAIEASRLQSMGSLRVRHD